MTLLGNGDLVARAGRIGEEVQAHGIEAEIVIEAVHEAGVGPVVTDSGELDAITPVGRGEFVEQIGRAHV